MRQLLWIMAFATTANAKSPAKLDVVSYAFPDGAAIPSEFTCDGPEVSPPLAWSKVPAGTKSIAVLVDDPDAPKGTYTHWLVTDIPPTMQALDKDTALPEGATASTNYKGPCPPNGKHHYRFRVYALDTTLPRAMGRAEFVKAVTSHILATGELVGTYERVKH